MKSALGLGAPAPTARARIFAGQRGRGAWSAPDARVALVMQSVVWNAVSTHVRPNVFARPSDERIYLHQRKAAIALDELRLRALRRLISADGGDPRVKSG